VAAGSARTFRAASSGLRRVRWGLVVAGVTAALATLMVGYLVYCLATLPFNGGLSIEPTASALVIEAADGQSFATRGVFKGEKLAADDLPPDLAHAIVAVEDRRFYEHHGVDLRGLARAASRNVSAGGTREGGSTITQQLVRMLYLSQERTLKRKVQEAMLALWLESQVSKDEILTRYLNTAYFGAGVYGADAAAKRYFGKTAKELSLPESAMLAGLVRAPSQLAPHRNLDGARGRAAQVLEAMVETGVITRAQADEALRAPAQLRVPPETPTGANYFVDLVAADAKRLIGSGPADAVVRTTLDRSLQNIAESVIERRLEAEGERKGVSQAALVALTSDGAILAMVGGRDYSESQFNRVTQARRQPGSLFKLFVYLTALQKGFTPNSVMTDRPTQIGEWEPENYGGRYRGPVTLKAAFANSINTIAVQLSEAVGVKAVIDTARGLGVQSDLPNLPSLALGSAEVTLLEMTRAYAAVGANLASVEPYTIRSISNRDQPLYTRPQTALPPARDPEARAAMVDLLTAVVRDGTGKAARVPGLVAGKTGTTQDNRDAWFIGFTPDIIVGVWVGNDDNSPTNNVTGGDLPAAIWRDFVTQAGRTGRMPNQAPQQAGAPQVAAAVPAAPAPAANMPANRGAEPAALRGAASVVDTGVLEIEGQPIRLLGVEGTAGRPAREFARYLRRRDVECERAADSAAYRCRADGQDLSEVVLFNGGGRASSDATPDLLAAEEKARSARIGVWRR
jgi:penicillin-binding protein 1A